MATNPDIMETIRNRNLGTQETITKPIDNAPSKEQPAPLNDSSGTNTQPQPLAKPEEISTTPQKSQEVNNFKQEEAQRVDARNVIFARNRLGGAKSSTEILSKIDQGIVGDEELEALKGMDIDLYNETMNLRKTQANIASVNRSTSIQ